MGQDPDAIRREIDETRGRMGETADAIGYKADVKERAKDAVSERKDAVVGKVGDMTSKVTGAVPEGEQVKDGARRAGGVAQSNPLGLAIGAAGVGFLVGLAIPSTRAEDERLGEVSDELKSRARETGREAMEHGREVVQTTAETVREESREHGSELASTLKENAGEVGSTASGQPQ